MKGAALLAVAVVVLGGAALVAWLVLGGEPAESPDGGGAPNAARGTPSPNGGDEPPKKAGTDRRPPPPPAPEKEPPIPEMPAEAVPGRGMRYAFGYYAASAAKCDWVRAGIECRKARRTLLDLARRIERGADPLPLRIEADEASHRIVHLCEPMFAIALRHMDMEPPIPIENAVLANPTFESNLLAATLDAWGRGLTKEQEEKVGDLYGAHAEVWESSRRKADAGIWYVDDLMALTKSRAALQTQLDEILTDTQRAALWPPELKGRVTFDLFSTAAIWRDRIVLAEIPEGEDPVPEYGLTLCYVLKTSDGGGALKEAAAAWLAEMPAEWKSRGVRSPLSRGGFVTEEQFLPAVHAWPALLREVEDRFAAARQEIIRPPAERLILLISRVTK